METPRPLATASSISCRGLNSPTLTRSTKRRTSHCCRCPRRDPGPTIVACMGVQMNILIRASRGGVARNGVLRREPNGDLVAVFSDGTIATGAMLGRVWALEPVADHDRVSALAAGFA